MKNHSQKVSQLLHNLYKVSLLNSEWMLWWKKSAVENSIKQIKDKIMKHALEDLLQGKRSAGDVVRKRAYELGLGVAFFASLAGTSLAQDIQPASLNTKQPTHSAHIVPGKQNTQYYVNPMADRYVKFGRDLDNYSLTQEITGYVSGLNPHINFDMGAGQVALIKAVALTGSRGVFKKDEYVRSIERLQSYGPTGVYLDSLDQSDAFKGQWRNFYQNEIITNSKAVDITSVKQKFDDLPRLNMVHTNQTDEIDKYVFKIVPNFAKIDGNRQRRILDYLDGFNPNIRTGYHNRNSTSLTYGNKLSLNVKPVGFPVEYKFGPQNDAIVFYELNKGAQIFLPPVGSQTDILLSMR